MSLSYEIKTDIIKKYGRNDKDTGSTEVQIALLTNRINLLSEHMQKNKHDHSSRRGLLMLVGQRKKLLLYFKKINPQYYRKLIVELGLRK